MTTLIVLYTKNIERLRAFYEGLGFRFVKEQHNTGPEHFSCTLDHLVLEIYPEQPGKPAGTTMMGFPATIPRNITDPDGKQVYFYK